MPKQDKTTQRSGQRGHAALHSAAAVRLMQSSRPPASQPPDYRAMMKLDRGTKVRVASAAAVVIAVLVATVCLGISAGIIGPRMATAPAGAGPQALTTRGFLELSVQADGWDGETSTPVLLRMKRDGEDVERYHALSANTRETVELDAGTYLISYISPVDDGGGIYRVPAEEAVEIAAGHTVSTSAQLTPVPAEETTRDEYLGILDSVQVAVEFGDETLRGEAGLAILAWFQANAESSPTYAETLTYPVWDYSYADDYLYDWYPYAGDPPSDEDDAAAGEDASDASPEDPATGDDPAAGGGDDPGAGGSDAGGSEDTPPAPVDSAATPSGVPVSPVATTT